MVVVVVATVIDDSALYFVGVPVFAGIPVDYDEPALSARMRDGEVLIRVDLGVGDGSGEAFGCDLTEQYVIENSEYST